MIIFVNLFKVLHVNLLFIPFMRALKVHILNNTGNCLNFFININDIVVFITLE